jgi:hypothetical protein
MYSLLHVAIPGADRQHVSSTAVGLAGRDQIKYEMPSWIEIFPDTPESGLELGISEYVIQGIEIGGDQIDRGRQA